MQARETSVESMSWKDEIDHSLNIYYDKLAAASSATEGTTSLNIVLRVVPRAPQTFSDVK